MLDQSGIKPFGSLNQPIFSVSSREIWKIDSDRSLAKRTRRFNWLFWQTGAAPFFRGGFGHFFHYAPEKIEYAINRFAMEAKRQLDLLDKEQTKPYIAGEDYTIADIAIWSWYGRLAQDKVWDRAGIFLDVKDISNCKLGQKNC